MAGARLWHLPLRQPWLAGTGTADKETRCHRRRGDDRGSLVRHAAGDGCRDRASSTPDPRAARLRNLGMHVVYGIGLFLSAVALSTLRPVGVAA